MNKKSSATKSRPVSASPASPEPKRGRILLLEDEFLIALDAQDILMELGAARVEVVNTLDAARQALERPQFDLALLDINVNGEMSFPVAEQFAVLAELRIDGEQLLIAEPGIGVKGVPRGADEPRNSTVLPIDVRSMFRAKT